MRDHRTHAARLIARLAAIAALAQALACTPAPLPAVVTPVSILVDPGPFASVEAAALGEAQVPSWADTSRAADACTAGWAALELRRFLAPCLGIAAGEIRLEAGRELPAAGDVFVIGRRAEPLVRSLLGEPDRDVVPAPERFEVRALRSGDRSVVVVAGASRAATLHGAYALLEQLGMRFHGLGDTGTVVPRAPRPLPRALAIVDEPRFRTRGFWAFEPRGDSTFFVWMARNRLNLWTAAAPDPAFLRKLGIRLTAGGHRVQADYLDPRAAAADGRSRFAAHPEWYGLRDGARRGDIEGETGTNFCTSNLEARRELARNLVADLTRGALLHGDVMQVWPLDGGAWCECDDCRAQGTPTDRWLDVVAMVTAETRAARLSGALRRDVELVAPAYLETLAPPTRPVSQDLDPRVSSVAFFPYFRCYAHALADTACSEINVRLLNAWRGWVTAGDRHYRGPVMLGEYYNVSWVRSLPVLYTGVMARDLPWAAQTSGAGVFYMHAPTHAWGAWTLHHAAYARLLWDPSAPADSIATAFCADYFGPAAEPMRAHFASLERATRNITALAHCVGAFGVSGDTGGGRLADERFPLFPLRHFQAMRTPGPANEGPALDEIAVAMAEARAALDRARDVDVDTLVAARVVDVTRRFEYGEAMMELWLGLIRVAGAHRARDAASARSAWPAIEAAAERLRGMSEVVQVAGSHADAPDGLAASQVVPTYEHFRRIYGR